MHSRGIAHRSGRGLDKSRIQAYRWRRVYRRATGGCDGSTAGHWASSNPAFTVSRRRCGTKPYTSSGSSRFPAMLLSLPPFGLRSGGRLEVICPELRPSRMAIHSMRRMAHAFTAPGDRLRGFTGPECSADLGKDSQAFTFSRITTHPPLKLWPFPLWTAFPSSEYYGHADSSQTHWRFSGLFPTHYFRSS
jgi:hypothetical protein